MKRQSAKSWDLHLLTESMPDSLMTMHAGNQIVPLIVPGDFVSEILMATPTGLLGDAKISLLDLQGLGEIIQCESEGMEKTIVRFRDPFAQGMVWQMAVITDSHMMVARHLPGLVMVLHDVAVRTGLGQISEITGTLSVAEGEGPHATQKSR